MDALAETRAFWLDIWTATRAHQIREYLRWRHNGYLKSYHRKAALEYAARVRELLK